jgi:hypothetical protein
LDSMIAYIDAAIINDPVEGWRMTNFIGPIYGAKNAHVIALQLASGTRGWDTTHLKAIVLHESPTK